MPKWRASSWRAFDPDAVGERPPAPDRGRVSRAGGDARAAVGSPAAVRILGLDPGSRRTGYGLVDCRAGETAHVAHGCIVAAHERPVRDAVERLRAIFEAVEALIESYRPDEIAVERVFVNRNVDSALKLGQARGAALSAVPRGTPVYEYAPRAIKRAVVGVGSADKRQVAYMMRSLLALTETLGADASDALAVAICHAHSRSAVSIERAALAGADVVSS
jgi:crossover junction endodeoxyribonuclease RuvC